jgi:predicted Rossmann fold nucleotide-binding protein DprA/Smf involved in DNA uptake
MILGFAAEMVDEAVAALGNGFEGLVDGVDLVVAGCFIHQEEVMTITKAFEVWEQETESRVESRVRQTRNVEIALNLLRENISLETIARTTGLAIAQVEALQAESR